jgi:hypothetical protein
VSLDSRKNALMWAFGWWFMRRWMRRRAKRAVAGIASGAVARRRSFGAVLGGMLLVGLLVCAFVAWRRLTAAPPAPSAPVVPYEPPAPPPEPEPAAA